MAMRSSSGSGDPRYSAPPPGSLPGFAGRASVSCKDLYSRTRSRSLRRPPPTGGCGWYEYGLYDVALELTEVPLRPFELEYRERTVLTPEEPPPIELPSSRQPPVLVKLKHKPRACAPPHPSTVRLRYEPEAAPLVFPADNQQKQQTTDKVESQSSAQMHKESEATGNASKERHKTEKADKHDKAEKTEKGEKQEKTEKHSKDKSEKKEKEKKKKDTAQEQAPKDES